MSLPDLITLNEYKVLNGIAPSNVRDDDRINALITSVSRSVRTYTDRRFEVAGNTATERVFQWDGSEILDIDDCVDITHVEWNGGWIGALDYPITGDQYTAMPFRETTSDDPYYYVLLHTGPGNYSPQMGFARNLDTIPYPNTKPATVSITAIWGWPEIPEDVKLATAWAVSDGVNKSDSGDLQAESIAQYSRNWAAGALAPSYNMGIPGRSRDLLAPYVRTY